MAGENANGTGNGDNVEVVIEGTLDNGPIDPIKAAADAALKPAGDGAGGEGGDNVEESIEQLRERLANAEARAQSAEAQVRASTGQLSSALNEVDRANLTVISSAMEQLTKDAETLKAQYAAAMADGDFAAAAEVQAAMTKNAVDYSKLEAGKLQLETKPRREARQEAIKAGDPVEQKIAEWNMSEKSAAWIRKNPQFATNPRLTQRMLAAHNMVMTDENAPENESPEYYAAVEKILGIGHTDTRRTLPAGGDAGGGAPLSGAADATQRRGEQRPPPAAPGGGAGGRPRVVRLSAAEAEAARISGLTPEQYHAQKQRIEAETKGQKPH